MLYITTGEMYTKAIEDTYSIVWQGMKDYQECTNGEY